MPGIEGGEELSEKIVRRVGDTVFSNVPKQVQKVHDTFSTLGVVDDGRHRGILDPGPPVPVAHHLQQGIREVGQWGSFRKEPQREIGDELTIGVIGRIAYVLFQDRFHGLSGKRRKGGGGSVRGFEPSGFTDQRVEQVATFVGGERLNVPIECHAHRITLDQVMAGKLGMGSEPSRQPAKFGDDCAVRAADESKCP